MKTAFALLLLLFPSLGFTQEKLVSVNGININVLVKGMEDRAKGSTVIVFENGMGVDLGSWNKVLDSIASFAPVVAYDRAGMGKSEVVFEMPTIQFVNENLHALLDSLQILPPYILVGHSFGGVYIRSYAGLYPDEIAGLVFVDPADFTETKDDWNDIFRTIGVPEAKIEEMITKRLYQPSKVDSVNFGPWSEGEVLRELRLNDFEEISRLTLPNVPIYFFVGGKFDVPVERRSKDFDQEQFFHVKNNSNMERWKKLIYASDKGGALIYLTNSGHYIQWDEPQSLIANIKVLVDSLKEKK
ncbi:alpha/beta fold hydrolase [Algoriphagus terrigena]|uniref:alpha/beta fold hydrolase n=1 Tax=Algoriphagus terrigena TaxID=344884 RepID=UPI0003F7D038|nr:alpha/beta hydrolase [Algoriphagus terrigena]